MPTPPRPTEAFELPEEDFLEVRPPKFDVAAFGEIDPPSWALRAITKIGGRRLPKRVKQYVDVHVPTTDIMPWGPPMGPQNRAHNGNSMDVEQAYQKAKRKLNKKKRFETPNPKTIVPKGNLHDDDYRFWKGYVPEGYDKDNAQCRWCGDLVHGRAAMKAHSSKTDCKSYLLALYRYAKTSSKQRYCMSCKKETHEKHWGFPLCRTPSCWGRWKFNYSVDLQGFKQYRTWAREAQYSDPENGPFSNLPALDEDDDVVGTPC